MDSSTLYNSFLKCTGIATDTRKITAGSMFFALRGDNFDANTFAAEALQKGARYVVIDNPAYKENDNMLLVDDSLTALQQLAAHHRAVLGLPIIGLTGSNGKTTTKELINAVLSKKYNTKATVGNLNNHIGVPLTLLSFTKDTEIGIVEMGANHQKEIEFLCSIAQPDFGYITNFGKAHLEGFGGYEGVIKGKSELYTYLEEHTKIAFVNLDDNIQSEKTAALPRYTFSTTNSYADVVLGTVTANPMVQIEYNDFSIQSHLIGIYNASNISAAITIGNYFKVANNLIKEAIDGYVPSNNRSQLIEHNSNNIILDAYNANPSSMAAAIANFEQIEAGNKTAFLGDMFELGNESPAEHKKVVQQAENSPNTRFVFIGKDFYANRIENSNNLFFEAFDGLKKHIENTKYQNSTLLIKGSRGMALERILDLL